MNVIKHTGLKLDTLEQAEEVLADLLATKGALFGYIDPTNQVTVFLPDYVADQLSSAQERVTLVFREPQTVPATSADSSEFLQNMGDALMGKGPWAR